MAERHCRNCVHKLRQDDKFCPNCGTRVYERAIVLPPGVDSQASLLLSMHREEDKAEATAKQGESTKNKVWWQTEMGTLVRAGLVGAGFLAVLFLALMAFFFGWSWVFLASLILGAGLLFGPALGLYDTLKGRDDEASISEAGTSYDQATEISKLCFEYFKHFTTITTAAALVELALYQQLGLTKASAIAGVGTLGFTLWLCIRGLVRLSVGTATSGNFSPIDRRLKRQMVSTAWFFLFGVLTFALASVNATVANNVSHLMYELVKSMAQNIR